VALVGLLIVIAVLTALWWREFQRREHFDAKRVSNHFHKPQLIKAVVVTLGVIAAFFAGVPVAMAAFLGGALLLVTRAIKAHKVYQEIDGSLLLMFAGLFVVVAAAEKILLTPEVIGSVQAFHSPILTCSPPIPPCFPTSSAMCRRSWRSSPSCLACPISIASGS
jgi:Na+/H+ antiporter NhaD/arsenite permease-like protein